MSSPEAAYQPCFKPVPEGPGDEDDRDNCRLERGHDGPHVGLLHAEWRQEWYFLAPTYRVVEEDDGWRVYRRVDDHD